VLARSALIFAAATLAVGVAGQEVIGALIGGLFLVANPNFNVGDWIAWGDREGVVEAIGFRTTRVRTENNETLTIAAVVKTAGDDVECAVSQESGDVARCESVSGLGASDCDCDSHLCFSESREVLERAVRDAHESAQV
jgi:hypothetical protein